MKFKKAVVPSMPSAAPNMNMAGAMGIPRRKMKRFKIDEISFVDKPAQEGALATIEKAAPKDPSATRASGPRVGRTSSGGLGRGLTGLRGRAKNPRLVTRREQVVQASAGKQLVNHIRDFQRLRGVTFNSPRHRIAQALVDHANAGATPKGLANPAAQYYGFQNHAEAQASTAAPSAAAPSPDPSSSDNPALVSRLQAAVGSDNLGKYNQNHDDHGRFSSGGGGGGGGGDKSVSARGGGRGKGGFKSGASAEELAAYDEGAQPGFRFRDQIKEFEQRQGVNQNSPRQKIAEALMRESDDLGDAPGWRDTAAHHYGFKDHTHVESFDPDPPKMGLINRLQGAIGMGKRELDRIIKMVLINGTDQFLKGAAGNGEVGRAPPLVSALDLSLRTILADTNLTDSDRLVMMRKSAFDFLKVATGELPNLEGYVRKSADPDVERSEATMNLRQLKKKMDVLNTKLDAVLSKRGSEDDELEFEEFDKADDDGDEGDDESLFKAGYKAADDNAGEDDTGQIAQRLNAMFGHSAVKARRKKQPPPDMGGGMDDIRAEINAENADQLGGDPSQADMGADDPDADDNMGKKMKTGPRRGQVTTEGEEEDKIASGSKTPIGGQSNQTAKRTRLHESMVIGDHVIHKSDVGSDMFEILKAQKEETDRIAKALDDERDTRELLEFAKVAEVELPHLPGTTESKARLLKNLAGYLDEDERRLLTSMLKSGDRSAGTAFKTYGAKVEKSRSAVDFQKRVSIIKSRDQCSYTEAMQKARKENPDEFEAFQYGGQ